VSFEQELGARLPLDYRSWCQQVGSGTLGHFRLFSPQPGHSLGDPRLHWGRLCDKLVPIGQDTSDDLWLAWQLSRLVKGDASIFIWDEQPRAPPPRLLAASFLELVATHCFAPRQELQRLGLTRFQEKVNPLGDKDPDDDWSDLDETLLTTPAQPANIAAGADDSRPPRTFRQFPSR